MTADIVLVEGQSDAAAVRSVAALLGHSLKDVELVAMGGATNIGGYLDGHDRARFVGLCVAGEEWVVRRALTRRGVAVADREMLADNGFFVCEADLEDELIRALGVAAVEGVLARQGELDQFRVFQNQPAQRDRPVSGQLRRFIGTKSGRKIRLGGVLAAELTPAQVPKPLRGLLDRLDP